MNPVILTPVPPKLYKAGEVCELVQVQAYVLRSWEKEFPGIGIQKSADSARLYRQSDVEQVQRIKQLVFGEGLTVAGARRRLEESNPGGRSVSAAEVRDVLDALSADARTRIGRIRDGLREIQSLLSAMPGSSDTPRGFVLKPPSSNGPRRNAAAAQAKARPAARTKSIKRGAVAKPAAARKKTSSSKRKHARARA